MVLVVVLFPVANDRAGFINLVEGNHIQALVTHTHVEGFNVAVAPMLTWWNVLSAKLANSEFVEGMGWEMNSGPLSHRSTLGSPRWAMILLMYSTISSLVIKQSLISTIDSRVCSSTIDASLTGVSRRRESNWKSIATPHSRTRCRDRARTGPCSLIPKYTRHP